MYSEISLILIKKFGGQCDIRYDHDLAYVNDCHMTENWMLQKLVTSYKICDMLSSKRYLTSFLKKAIETDFYDN